MKLAAGSTLQRTAEEDAARLMETLPMLRALAKRPFPRVAIKVKSKIIFINPGDVLAVKAEGNYTSLQQDSSSYLLRKSISALAEMLEAYGFIRIHRSVLVNTAFVEEITQHPAGKYRIKMKGGREYTVTRTYRMNLKSLAEFWIGIGTFFPE